MKDIDNNYKKIYDIISPIGSGGFSTVYKAKVKGTQNYRAIKIINKDKIKSEYKKIREIFFNEVENMKICGKNNKNSVKF